MKKILFVSALFLVYAAMVFGQSPVWELSRDGKTLYLGGSVHVLREEDFPLPAEFSEALEAAEMLVLEADIEQITNPALVQVMTSRMFLRGTTLKKLLSPGVFAALEERSRELGVSMVQLNYLKPMVASSMLSMLQIKKLGFVRQGADVLILEQAKEQGKKIAYLESVEFQLDLLFETGTGYEDEVILYGLDDFDNMEQGLAEIIGEWRKGASAYLDLDLAKMKNSFPRIYNAVYLERNNAWIPQIEAYLETAETEFILVGYAHLYGSGGLLEQLGKRGVKIRQL
ncbi:MAG: TraB/GumN family protein [Treponema sp.]|jgi:uncharacterized protein YbaP (TraB family)|nr:TraB/GumN family protein [Treponema sp.]